jgi:Family of unknown function (DUF6526)
MATQSYATHRHTPTRTAIGFLFLVVAIVGFALRGYGIGGHVTMAVGLFGLVACSLVLLLIGRVYTTALQDRIIKLEMRVRCASILTPPQQAIVARLDKPQLVALRFASDAELPALAEQAEREHLSADQIKRAIKNWVPDWDRT